MPTKVISKERFDALCRVKRSITDYMSREVEWYSDAEERVIGIVFLALRDEDWLWMVLGREPPRVSCPM